ncbi:MAG: NIPSNAP family protein [Anaerolineae bacterium]|nr:NIPSNAP family protein [Anaerolineae bacterium]
MFFELRQYRVLPGKRDEWVRMMEEEIIPFQIAQGMVVIGSFVGQEEDDLYVWIRRFESEEQREALYAKVYQSETWQNEISPRVGALLDRTRTVVTRLVATPKSVIQ